MEIAKPTVPQAALIPSRPERYYFGLLNFATHLPEDPVLRASNGPKGRGYPGA